MSFDPSIADKEDKQLSSAESGKPCKIRNSRATNLTAVIRTMTHRTAVASLGRHKRTCSICRHSKCVNLARKTIIVDLAEVSLKASRTRDERTKEDADSSVHRNQELKEEGTTGEH
jgi:hypothetical protein